MQKMPTELEMRQAWVRVIRDSPGLPSTVAAHIVATMFGVSATMVYLAVGATGRQAVGREF